MIFAAAATIAVNDHRLVGTLWATDSRLQLLARIRTVRTNCDLRLLSILLRSRQSQPAFVPGAGGFMMPNDLPNFAIQIPFNRIQVFAGHPWDSFVQMLPQFKRVGDFVESARREKISSEEVDRFLADTKHSIDLSARMLPSLNDLALLDQLFVGTTPELYDVSVRALTAMDNAIDGAANRAIENVSKDAPFWPRDLEPHEVPTRDRDRRAALLARVVVHADRCGLLVPLLEYAGGNGQSGQLARLGQLARRYEDFRRFNQAPGRVAA